MLEVMSTFDIRFENWWFFHKIFGKWLKFRQSEKKKNKKLASFWARKI